MNREELKAILPQREPMLLVDEAWKNEDGTAGGQYTVRGDEFFVQGHFPGNPVVPGVILCEMAAQCSCMLMADKVQGKITMFTGLDHVKFKNPVRPGDTVVFTATHLRAMSFIHKVSVVGEVDGKTVVSLEFTIALVDPSTVQ
ncbi:MAG: beta-hydroxyacyl-ACP dehydratase [Clostridia bacterium]|nr:beta-hydroxyacyl-ACP dehydratase [Clostridia bacterium]